MGKLELFWSCYSKVPHQVSVETSMFKGFINQSLRKATEFGNFLPDSILNLSTEVEDSIVFTALF